MKIGILGCGFSGKAIGHRFAQSGGAVWGTSRSIENCDSLRKSAITPVIFDGSTINNDLTHELIDTTHLVISIAPPREENALEPETAVDPILIALSELAFNEIAPNLQWVSYLSTVGVYGDHDGDWIDETTPAQPTSARSRQRVKAELEWLQWGEAHKLPVTVFRLSGIYGPGRNGLLNASLGKSRRLVKKDQVFNRIHVEDIAHAICQGADKGIAGIFNITDDEPAPPQDVVEFAHQLLKTSPPPEIDFETAELSPMARSFYGENKRVSNAKSKSVLGMRYDWPNYRASLKRMYDEDSWKA